ncbi:MAG: hypothetical protein M3066_00520 [Actinomycetota bacterium]|nr:hypothetical protein [Actinomycetota bacterium]
MSLFGGPPTVRGFGQTVPPGDAQSASPAVTLPAGGSVSAVTATDADGALARYGPAVVFGGRPPADPDAPIPPSGAQKASTKGKLSVTSAASVKNVGAGPFSAGSVSCTCNARKAGTKATTTITRGVLVTATDADGNTIAREVIPAHPPVDLTFTGTTDTGDNFKAVFNEQSVASDGTITVVAVHIYMLGPTAVGDVVIARAHSRA